MQRFQRTFDVGAVLSSDDKQPALLAYQFFWQEPNRLTRVSCHTYRIAEPSRRNTASAAELSLPSIRSGILRGASVAQARPRS